ncbi:MAG: DNA/RNA non-specific endonuclease, partial [Chitinophagaceae bacterium]
MYLSVRSLAALLALALFLSSCKKDVASAPAPEDAVAWHDRQDGANVTSELLRLQSDNLLMGNPSGAVADVAAYSNYLMSKLQYALSYNRNRATPNWVSWHLDPSWLGSAPRQDDFRSDATLPTGWYRVGSTSYSGSGFDRGHNCPSADRSYSTTDNSATFLMTNMIPQAPTNNQQTWANLENYCRTLVNQGNELYVIMGSYGTGGTGTNGTASTIDAGRITVPNRVWKVIVVLPRGTGDVARVTTSTRVIAVNTPNTNSISTSWGS